MMQLRDTIHVKVDVMSEYEDDFMNSCISQLKFLASQDPVLDTNVAKCYRNLLTVIDTVSIKTVENIVIFLLQIKL